MTDPLAVLTALFVERCGDDLRNLRRLRDQADTDELSVIAHRLAGAAGSFGFPDISTAARVVDQKIRDGVRVPVPDMERLLALLAEISDPNPGFPRQGRSTDIP